MHFLGFLWSNLGFSKGYNESKSKISSPVRLAPQVVLEYLRNGSDLFVVCFSLARRLAVRELHRPKFYRGFLVSPTFCFRCTALEYLDLAIDYERKFNIATEVKAEDIRDADAIPLEKDRGVDRRRRVRTGSRSFMMALGCARSGHVRVIRA